MVQINSSPLKSGSDSLLSILKGTGTNSVSNGVGLESLDARDSSSNPASILDLSKQAKELLSKLDSDQEVADKLQEVLASLKGEAEKSGQSSSSQDVVSQLFGTSQKTTNDGSSVDALKVMQDAAASGFAGFDFDRMESEIRKMNAGEGVYRDVPASEEGRIAYHALSRLIDKVVSFEDEGKTDQAQALRSAIKNGTVKVQNPDDVAGLNYTRTRFHFADAGAGGTYTSSSSNPVGDARESLANGQALTWGLADYGGFYLSW